MSVRVKICGIRNIEATLVAVKSGADFLGFNFVPTSERYIDPDDAVEIIQKVKGKVKIVGVFQNADIDLVKNLSKSLGLDFVQLHGNEDNEYINNVGIPVIKFAVMDDRINLINADYLLLDRIERGGAMVDFKKAAELAADHRVFFAGGLNPDNVADVIKKVQPFAVDVAGGIETDGVIDLEKIELFIKNAREAYE